jgi:hypothetical protein
MTPLLKRTAIFAFVLFLSGLALVVSLHTTLYAQSDIPTLPIVLNLQLFGENGGQDIYTWSEGHAELARLSTWGYNAELALSPDGRQIAYHSTATVAVEAIKVHGGFGGGKAPGNIWIMDTATGEADRIADQPADAAFLTDHDKAIIRSMPFWSPDGTQVGWVEYDYPEQSNTLARLMIYDIATGTTSTPVSDLPMQAGQGAISQGTWTDTGIAVTNTGVKPNTDAFEFTDGYLVYSPEGMLLNRFELETSSQRFIRLAVFTKSQGRDAVVVRYTDNTWERADLLTGEVQSTTAPFAYSAFTPGKGVHFTYDEYAQPIFFGEDGEQLAVPRTTSDVAISPDGQELVFDLTVYRAGSKTELPFPSDLNYVMQTLWSPLVWILPE